MLEPRSFPYLFPSVLNTPNLPYSAELKRKAIHLPALAMPIGLLILGRPTALWILAPLSLLALANQSVTLISAGGVGLVTGFSAAFIIRRLKKHDVGRVELTKNLVGSDGTVLLAIAKGQVGKVRIKKYDRVFDLVATTDDSMTLERGNKVLVIKVREGRASVVAAPS